MSPDVLSLIEKARRVVIELVTVFDDILIKHGKLTCRTIPSKEDRYLLKNIKSNLDR